MKKIIAAALAAMTLASLGNTVFADYEPNVDYMSLMIEAAMEGNIERGTQAQNFRNQKIEDEGLEYAKVSFEDLYLIAKVIQAEAGSAWLSDEWKMAVGEVVLNRVASPEFPDTVREVVEAPGQYYGSGSSFFNNLKPSLECVLCAKRLLEGERVLNEPAVVFQSNSVQGGGIYWHLYDAYLGSTYFCYSSNMHLYED